MPEQVHFHTTARKTRMNREIFRRLAAINLFDNAEGDDEATGELLQRQLRTTHLYIILLSAALGIVVLFTCLDQKLIQHTVSAPLLEDYERLQSAYGDSLSCPCEQGAIPYPKMVSLVPTFHQVIEKTVF